MKDTATKTKLSTRTKVLIGLAIAGGIIAVAGYGWRVSIKAEYTHHNPGGGQGTAGVEYSGTIGGKNNSGNPAEDASDESIGGSNTSTTNTNSSTSNTNTGGSNTNSGGTTPGTQ